MKLSDLGEFGLIAQIQRLARCTDPAVLLGIGDDCALINTPTAVLAVTTDAMLEGRHFCLNWLTAHQIGARAMTAALSDIAAMGAQPRFTFASLALPPAWPATQACALAIGLEAQARRFGACLLGGDTIAAHEHALIDIMAIGECGANIWRRDGARPGQVVCVTGDLGGSAVALAARIADLPDIACWQRYAEPTPRLEAAAALASLGLVTAAIDISDGLVQDAGHLCERSHVGICLHAPALPISPQTRLTSQQLGLDPLQFALGGGEDFELLLTAPPEFVTELQHNLSIPLTVIGEVVAGSAVTVLDENKKPLEVPTQGWDHFTGA